VSDFDSGSRQPGEANPSRLSGSGRGLGCYSYADARSAYILPIAGGATYHQWGQQLADPFLVKAPSDEVRPLSQLARGRLLSGLPITAEALQALEATETYSNLLTYFNNYPTRSLMSDVSRAVLYSLIQMLRPQAVAEIGTLFAGTTEVFARALWEIGSGILHTTDPFGADRCPGIIGSWPKELQEVTRYYPLGSMEFFLALDREGIALDMVLVDGNHDFEFALFDLQMSARRLRPGGIIIMDNSEQSGPFYAAKAFLAAHPAWKEIGKAVESYNRFRPFEAATRTSVPGTSFIVLKAPEQLSIDAIPRSSGQIHTELSNVKALSLDLPAQVASGTLFCQVFLRSFADSNRDIQELQTLESIRLDIRGGPMSFPLKLSKSLHTDVQSKYDTFTLTYEIDLSWQANDSPSSSLFISRLPTPLEN
jgi:predicted O-methyltransferase YrrM